MPFSKSFSLGIIAAFFAFVLEQAAVMFISPAQPIEYSEELNFLLIISVLIEELVKYSLIYKNSLELTNKKAILYNALFIGLGFSLMEIVFQLLKLNAISPSLLLPFSGVLLIHLATSLVMGFFISKAKKLNKKSHLVIIFIAFLIHLSYNAVIISALSIPAFNFPRFTVPDSPKITLKKTDSITYGIILFAAFLLYEMHRIVKNMRKIISILVK